MKISSAEDSNRLMSPRNGLKTSPSVPSIEHSTITITTTFKIIASTGGIMICARFVTSAGNFVTNIMLSNSVESAEAQQLIAEAGALIGSLQRVTLALLSVWLSVYGNEIGRLFKATIDNQSDVESKEKIGRLYRQSLLFSCVFTVPTFFIFFFANNLFELIGEPEAATNLCQEFFRSFVYGVLPQLLSYNIQTLAISTKRPWQAFFSNVIYTVVNIPATYLLVTRMRMGYKGMGWAATISNTCSVLVLFLYHKISNTFNEHHLYNASCHKIITKNELCDFVKNGGKYSLQLGVELGTDLLIATWIGLIDHNELDDSQVAFQYLYLLLNPLANAVGAVSYAVSQESANIKNARKILYIMIGFSVSIPLVVLIFSFGFSKQFISLFLDENNDLTVARNMMWLALASLCLSIPRFAMGAYIRGLTNDNGKALKASIASNGIASACGAILCYLTPLKSQGFFIGKIMGEIGALPWLMFKTKQAGINVPEQQNATPSTFRQCLQRGKLFFTCCRREESVNVQEPLINSVGSNKKIQKNAAR